MVYDEWILVFFFFCFDVDFLKIILVQLQALIFIVKLEVIFFIILVMYFILYKLKFRLWDYRDSNGVKL